jgi:hypothetical protein
MAVPNRPISIANLTAVPSDVTSPPEADAEEGWWQVIDRQLNLAVADESTHDSVDDLGPSSEGNGSRQSTEYDRTTHDGDDGSGYKQLRDREASKKTPRFTVAPDPQLMSCDNGHSVSLAQHFCPACGVPIAASPNSLRRCSRCGTNIVPEASFCSACGRSLSIRGASPTPGPLTLKTSKAPPARAHVARKPRNPLAVCSIALLLLGSIGALVAIPMGFVARRQIRRSRTQQKGAGLALAAIIIGFVFVGITLVITGVVLANSGASGGSGPSLSGLASTVKGQIAGNGSDSLKVPGVASVVCNPPNSWQTGEHFTCIASSSTGSKIGAYDGTVEPDSSSGKYQWSASWYPG